MRDIRTAFNHGEWSPKLRGRVDLSGEVNFYHACELMKNMIPIPAGPALRRPGFRYINETKDSTKTSRLIPFQFSNEDAFILEFGHQYIRFYKNHAAIVVAGPTIYEVATTYTSAQVADLKFAQSLDVLFICHPDHPPRKLSRVQDHEWYLNDINFSPPALQDLVWYPSGAIVLSGTTGTITATHAPGSMWLPGDVQRTFRAGVGRATITGYTSASVITLTVIDDFSSTTWASGEWSISGTPFSQLRTSKKEPIGAEVTIYCDDPAETTTDLTLGGFPFPTWWTLSGSGTNEYYLVTTFPSHPASKPDKVLQNGTPLVEATVGSLIAGQWAWANNDGLAENTVYVRLGDDSDPDSKAAGYVQAVFINGSAGIFRNPASMGNYLQIHGGLIHITGFENSATVTGIILSVLDDNALTYVWTLMEEAWTSALGYPVACTFFQDRLWYARGLTVWGSVSQDYENFTPGANDDDSVTANLLSREANYINWLFPSKSLICGGIGGPWIIKSGTGVEGIVTPSSLAAQSIGDKGCSSPQPVFSEDSLLYIQRHGKKLRELTYQFTNDGYIAPNLAELADHLTSDVLIDAGYQDEPYGIIFYATQTGGLLGLTYLRGQAILAWHQHSIGGSVESLAVIPGSGSDELYAIVNRTIDGATVRYIEMLEPFFEDDSDTFISNKGLNARFLDCMYTYNSTPTTTITGLDHLEGETVQILADGMAHPDKTVSSGQITLNWSASVVHVGLHHIPILIPTRPELQTRAGTSQGKIKQINELIIRFDKTSVAEIGRTEDGNFDDIPFRSSWDSMDAPIPLFSGDKNVEPPGMDDTDGYIAIRQPKPLPFMICAIVSDIEIGR